MTSRQAKELPSVTRINVSCSTVQLSGLLKLLRLTLDAAISFDGHIKNVCKASLFPIRALRHIRLSLNCVACFLIKSRLDYENSLYIGMSLANVDKLQQIQNTLARVLTSKKRSHFTYSQAASLDSDLPSRRLQGVSARIQNTAV